MPLGNILLVEDEIKIRALLKRILSLENYNVFEAGDLKSAHLIISREDIHVIICDVMLPDGNGIEFTKDIRQKKHQAEIIILTAHANIPDSVLAMRSGAFDYLTKAEDNDRLLPMVSHAMEKALLQSKLTQLKKQVGSFFGFSNIIGKSVQIQDTIALAKKVANSDTTVLLLGETGTGKELFARAIHCECKREYGAFVAVNCSAFSRNLLESELFGHKAGAFTGAIKDKTGLIEEANEGTLFLDEIGEMDIELQAKLLRVLESNEFIKVGDTKTTKVKVRIIAATMWYRANSGKIYFIG
jgi:two-component system, NtrC family, response regulator